MTSTNQGYRKGRMRDGTERFEDTKTHQEKKRKEHEEEPMGENVDLKITSKQQNNQRTSE